MPPNDALFKRFDDPFGNDLIDVHDGFGVPPSAVCTEEKALPIRSGSADKAVSVPNRLLAPPAPGAVALRPVPACVLRL